MDLGLKNKVVLITGGNSGLGFAAAIEFAKAGAKVVIAARNAAKCEEAVSMIKQAGGGDCIYVKTDIAKPKDVKAMVQKTMDTYGRLDCAVNNAGYHSLYMTDQFPEEEWDITVNLNLKGLWMCMKYEIPAMRAHGGGVILNVASTAGHKGFMQMSAYNASKHGVVGLTRTASMEYAKEGIRVNTICPGQFRTPMLVDVLDSDEAKRVAAATPMGRFGEPEEFADAAVWLCSDRSSYITGISLGIDGGLGQH